MKFFLFILSCLFVLTKPAGSQSLSTELNSIALDNDMMGCAVVTFCESQILDTYYYGKSDYQRNIFIDQHTKFRIASISKTITASAIMQLSEQNMLDLNADISSILGYNVQNPYFPNTAITVKMLLSHTSSIIDGTTYNSFMQATVNNNPIINLSELLTQGGNYYTASQFNSKTPGSYFNYSNINYVILGTIVEKISGLRFDIYCNQHIFEPLSLDASFNVNDLQDINQVAVLYRKTSGVWTPQADNFQGTQPVHTNLAGYVPGTNGGRFGPQGGLRISAQDLVKIFMCIFNPDLCTSPLVSAQSSANMIANHWTYFGNNGNYYSGLFRSWGLGIHRITSTPGNDIVLPGSQAMFGHTGEAYGLVSDAYYDFNRKTGLVFITNGVGVGYQTNSNSAFYTVEQDVFNAIEEYGNLNTCFTVNIDPRVKKDETFVVSTNQACNTLNISLTNFTKACTLKIYNTEAKQVMETLIVSPESTINISSLNKGIYLLQIDQQFERFVKF